MEAQWIDPITSEDTQPERGPPGKKAPAAAGCKEDPPIEAPTPSVRIQGKAPRTTPDPEQGSWRRTSNQNMGQGRTMERAKYNRSSCPQRGPPGNPPRGTGCAEQPQTEGRGLTRKLTITPDPNGDTKPSFRSRTKEPRPCRGDPIVKVGNPSREEDPLEQGEPEPDGGRRTGKKPRNLKTQQAVCAQPQV